MALVNAWTGRTACALQAALRLSNESFARRLGIGVRTVANWHQKPDLTPLPETQQLLDTLFEQASESERARFETFTGQQHSQPTESASEPDSGHALTVAITIVVNDQQVLLVQRRGDDGGGIAWQFPAGMVKPGVPPEQVAIRETLAETGIHCGVVRHLGSRLHPITNVHCDYYLCEYLAGDAQNIDIVENVSVTWIPKDRLIRFIPAKNIFAPILEALEIPSDGTSS